MTDFENIVQMANDNYRGKVEKYSASDVNETLRKAFIEANNGKTSLDYRAVRDGKCGELFALIETIISNNIVEGLRESDFFNSLVDYRDMAEGDKNEFVIEDNHLFIVSKAADGTQGIRRQRLGGAKVTEIPTELRVIKIYEELNRILSGRVDFNYMINNVAKSFKQNMLKDIYTLWQNVDSTAIGSAYYPVAAPYDEDTLLDTIAHVEAAADGKTATIVGTKKALRKLNPALVSDKAKDDLYDMGYMGRFYGSPVVAIPQRHAIGSTSFLMEDDKLIIVAGDDRPIKVVREGNPLVIYGNPLDKADLTQEYLYAEKWGVGLVLAGGNTGLGVYEYTTAVST